MDNSFLRADSALASPIKKYDVNEFGKVVTQDETIQYLRKFNSKLEEKVQSLTEIVNVTIKNVEGNRKATDKSKKY